MSKPPTALSRWIAVLFIALMGLSVPDLALAQEEVDEEEQAAKHFANGRKLYSDGKYHEAISELLKAYNLRPAPPILLNIARTYEKLKEKKKALKFYKEFLLKARMTNPQRPMVEKVVKTLQKEVGGKTGAVTSSAGTDTPEVTPTTPTPGTPRRRRLAQLIHTPVDSAKCNTAVTLMAELPPNLTADNLVVHYRKGGEMRLRHAYMEQQGEAYVAQIPHIHVNGTSMQYWIEAIKAKGNLMKVVARAGSKGMPNIIVIDCKRGTTTRKPGDRDRDIIGGGTPGGSQRDVESPYRIWIWVGAGATAAFLGVGIAGAALAADRESAMEKTVFGEEGNTDNASCTAAPDVIGGKPKPSCGGGQLPPSRVFMGDVRTWEKEGKTFATVGQVFFALSIAAAAATGVMFFLDRKYVSDQRRKKLADTGKGKDSSTFRVMGAPWAAPTGAGLMGRIEF